MYPTRHGLPHANRQQLVTLLNQVLADCLDLQCQARQAHWNVRGAQFLPLHELFGSIADFADESADELAERAAALGGHAEGTVQAIVAHSRLTPYPLAASSATQHLEALAAALADFGNNVRQQIGAAEGQDDPGTADLLTGLSREIDKKLWFVEAHLAPAKP
jgi:starvation-inducible DNA-binding protein